MVCRFPIHAPVPIAAEQVLESILTLDEKRVQVQYAPSRTGYVPRMKRDGGLSAAVSLACSKTRLFVSPSTYDGSLAPPRSRGVAE